MIVVERAYRSIESRALIDRPIEVVWKRAKDLAVTAAGRDRVVVHSASPDGGTLVAALVFAIVPYRVCLEVNAAVIDADEFEHRVQIRGRLRDRYGRGSGSFRAVLQARALGSGTELDGVVEVDFGGALVRATGEAMLRNLDGAMRAWFVAIAGDAFGVDAASDDEPLAFVGPNRDDSAHDGDALACSGELLTENNGLAIDDAVGCGPIIETAVAAPIPRSATGIESHNNGPARFQGRFGLPPASLPRPRGLRSLSRRSVTQTAGTVVATAAVVAAVAGAVAVRRFFGRR